MNKETEKWNELIASVIGVDIETDLRNRTLCIEQPKTKEPYKQKLSEEIVKHYIQVDRNYIDYCNNTDRPKLSAQEIDKMYNEMTEEERDNLVLSYV